MKKQIPVIEKVAKKVVRNLVEQEIYGWPPQCAALYYQPARPRKKENPESVNQLKSMS